MFKKILFSFALVTGFALQTFAGSAVPSTFADFEKLSANDMKALPDYKWTLGKPVTAADTKGKSEVELMLLRNSIYAQHGIRFTQKSLQAYFVSRSWYKPARDEGSGFMGVPQNETLAAHDFLHAQAALTTQRDVAEDDNDGYHSIEEAVSYNLFNLGFCTYANQYTPKAGVIIFEAGGVARIFHSEASQQYSVDAYSADKPQSQAVPSRLIMGHWSIKAYDKHHAKVYVTINASDLPSAGGEDTPIATPGTREVIDTKTNYAQTRDCTMLLQKKQ